MEINKGKKEKIRRRSWFGFDQWPCGVALQALLRHPGSTGVIGGCPLLQWVRLRPVGGGCDRLTAA
jgi:hypothetical protein